MTELKPTAKVPWRRSAPSALPAPSSPPASLTGPSTAAAREVPSKRIRVSWSARLRFAWWAVRARLEPWAMTHFKPLWRLAQSIAPLEGSINRFAVNSVVGRAPARPYPLSSHADYASWTSLTDQKSTARQLPRVAGPARTEPTVDQVAALFERGEKTIECPKSTVLFAYVAQWFTDGFLRSGRVVTADGSRDITRNESNNQIDLGQLYGFSPEVTKELRWGHGGLLKATGKAGEEFPPGLCDDRGERLPEFAALPEPIGFAGLTPGERSALFAMGSDVANSQIGYTMLNVLFLREHNRIARELDRANPEWRGDDVRLFETARNVLTVLLIKLVIEEYINHIAPYWFQFKLEPGSFERAPWMRPNWVAVEFNLLYRWHSLVPSTLQVGGTPMSIKDTMFKTELLTRHGIGRLIEDASKQPAGKIALYNTDAWLHHFTTRQSVTESRGLNLDSYNEYRKAVKLPPKKSFAQISPDRRVQADLRRLYGKVDDVELYAGLYAEEPIRGSVVPELMGVMVGIHAFSQLMTSPLLAPEVYNEATFSPAGMEMIRSTGSLATVVNRNPRGGKHYVSLTRRDWPQ